MSIADGRAPCGATGTGNEVRVSSSRAPRAHPEGAGVLQNACVEKNQSAGPQPRSLSLPASDVFEVFRHRDRGASHHSTGDKPGARSRAVEPRVVLLVVSRRNEDQEAAARDFRRPRDPCRGRQRARSRRQCDQLSLRTDPPGGEGYPPTLAGRKEAGNDRAPFSARIETIFSETFFPGRSAQTKVKFAQRKEKLP